jgi:hypothetical protein
MRYLRELIGGFFLLASLPAGAEVPGLPVRKPEGPTAEAQTDAMGEACVRRRNTAAGWWCAERTSATRR